MKFALVLFASVLVLSSRNISYRSSQ